MESIYFVPTPKTPPYHPHETTHDDRLRVQTLYYDAGWSVDDIIL